jgi:hypothetical protein
MPIGDPYVSEEEFRSYMDVKDITMYTSIIPDVLAATQDEIDDYCHRQFNDSGAATPRLYKSQSSKLLAVDDFSTLDGLVVETRRWDDTEWTVMDATSYEVHPYGGMHNGKPGYPYTKIVPTLYSHFWFSDQIRVTARWGWTSVPAGVIQAFKIMASDTFQLKDSRMGIAGSDTFGQIVRVRDNMMAKNKLDRFVRGKAYVA